MAPKPNKYARRSQISSDIDRLFPDHKNLVLEQGNFAWTNEQLDVARAKGITINRSCPQLTKPMYGFEQGRFVKL